MTDSVAQAADAVKSDIAAISAADAAGGATAAAVVAAGDAAHIAGQAVIAGADVAEVAVPAATTLFEKLKAELVDDVLWFEDEWALLKAAIAKHL
jgi:hypothetical protein